MRAVETRAADRLGATVIPGAASAGAGEAMGGAAASGERTAGAAGVAEAGADGEISTTVAAAAAVVTTELAIGWAAGSPGHWQFLPWGGAGCAARGAGSAR